MQDHAGHQALLPDRKPAKQQPKDGNAHKHLDREYDVGNTLTDSLKDERRERASGESTELPQQVPAIDNFFTNACSEREPSPQCLFSECMWEHCLQAA